MGFMIIFCVGKHLLFIFSQPKIDRLGVKFSLTAISPLIQTIFTMFVSKYLKSTCVKIVDIIFPKTQDMYEKLIVYLVFTLDLLNNYVPLFYVAGIRVILKM